MPEIDGITFDDASHKLILELIDQLKVTGVVEVYGLPNMHKGKGELRLAHYRPVKAASKAKGLFAQIAPRTVGAVFIYKTRAAGDPAHVSLSASTFDKVLKIITTRRDVVRPRVKGFEA